MDILDRPIGEIRVALDAGAASSAALIERWIGRTRANAKLNCYVEFDEAGLRHQADVADARLARGERLPLLGIPIALKDNIDAIGFSCGNGTRSLHGRHPSADAELVRRLRAAGALIAGKLGLHELAHGITSNNAVTGAIANPWDLSRIPGGSSGGAGAAVAAGLVPAAIGTDTGGSIRVPASLCGVVGLRPTVGRVSTDGIAPISKSRDTAGPLARTVADVALLDGILTGDSAPLKVIAPPDITLGLPRHDFWENLDPGVGRLAEATVDLLRDRGVKTVDLEVPGVFEIDAEIGFVIALYEFKRGMTEYLRDRARGVTFAEVIAGVRSTDVKALTRALDNGGNAVTEQAYQGALERRWQLRRTYQSAFATSGVHALFFPTTPHCAARIGEDEIFASGGRTWPTFATFIRNTGPGSLAGIPGLSIPVGLSAGLPVGMELDGQTGSDRHLLAVGATIAALLPPMPHAPAST